MERRYGAFFVMAAVAAALVGSTLLAAACSDRRGGPGAAATGEFSLPPGFPSGPPFFVRVPAPADWRWLAKPPLSFKAARKWGPYYELRHADLGRLDLRGQAADLLDAFFDSETKWPERLPDSFDPAALLALHRDPGLGLRALHARGLTGRGVSVGIVDTPLLLDHVEYAGRLRFYGEVNGLGVPANFHGGLVTSILAGRTCGVAPEAEVYYVGSHNFDIVKDAQVANAGHYARALDRLLEVNARLPPEKKIRVVSISAGWGPKNRGFKAMNKAVARAAEAGIFIISGNSFDAAGPGFWIWGFDRRGADDPNDTASCRVLPWKEWASQVGGRDRFDLYYAMRLERTHPAEFLVLPEGPKTVAHPGGREEYGYYRIGGWSSIFPFVAGLYALACQVDPDITPEVFWRTALAMGRPVPVEGKTGPYRGRIVDPARLLEALGGQSSAALRSASALSVFSQVKSGSLRPKCP